MKHALLLAAALASALPVTLATASPAAAQSPQLEQACMAVAKNFLLIPSIKTGIVQSFPELDPPGARLTYSTREDAKPTDFNNEIDCEFDKASPPFTLMRFCISKTCYGPGEQEPDNRRRYQEVKALMDRHK
jgi:SpoU rRNA methylase family enzyme